MSEFRRRIRYFELSDGSAYIPIGYNLFSTVLFRYRTTNVSRTLKAI
ncbi:MAG: hypothetical protein ACLUKN_17595 [Bacilli bacterium]